MDKGKRYFTKDDRTLLYVVANGKCQQCGQPLEDSFHADHKVPYSKDGPTDVINAQSLCPRCNLTKGGKSMLPEWKATLRDWQQDTFNDFQSQSLSRRDYLLVATPGSGKTRIALRIAHWLFQRGQIEQLIVVTPTSHLRRQWADEAARLAGIQLDPKWEGPTINTAMNGIAITYQMVAMGSNDKLQRLIVSHRNTLVILDEIHHAGEQRRWGDAIQHSYELATYRLLLSGTPFRSDNFPIAFVSYDPQTGICRPDCIYDYGTALKDDVCREVLFPSFNGRIEYMLNGEVINVSFDDFVDETGGSNRLRMALSADGDWIKDVIRQADNELVRIRKEQPDAAGLLIAIDQKHACDIAAVLSQITGQTPIIAISDEPKSSDYIKAFCLSKAPWLIAVKMVSEGVDIPRLRVGVYATNVTSELFFRQAVGRFVRMQREYEDQTAYFYIPEDARLINFARQIKEERQHAIEELEQFELARDAYLDRAESTQAIPTLIQATAEEGATIYDSDTFPPDELERARMIAHQAGVRLLEYRVDVVTVAKILRTVAPMTEEQKKRTQAEPPLYEKLGRLRRIYNRNVNYLAHISQIEHKRIHLDCKFIDGKWAKDCNEKDLYGRIQYLKEQINIALKKGQEDGRHN